MLLLLVPAGTIQINIFAIIYIYIFDDSRVFEFSSIHQAYARFLRHQAPSSACQQSPFTLTFYPTP